MAETAQHSPFLSILNHGFEQTPEDQIESHTFDLSEEGLDLAITWLWERFEAERDRWTQASQEIMHTVKKHTL